MDRVLIDYNLPSVRAQILSDTLLPIPTFPMSASDSNYLKIWKIWRAEMPQFEFRWCISICGSYKKFHFANKVPLNQTCLGTTSTLIATAD